ncbi:hypothetical protein [Actinomadura sp. KC216]|nr:hypothetical protein [Actinomadura sp. KC216]
MAADNAGENIAKLAVLIDADNAKPVVAGTLLAEHDRSLFCSFRLLSPVR